MFRNCLEDEYEYDAIGSNITEEELIQILEEFDYVLPDNITGEGNMTVSKIIRCSLVHCFECLLSTGT